MPTARVLWVTDEAPDRSLGGGSIRQSYLFEALASAFPVDLIAVHAPPDEHVRSVAASVTELPRASVPWTEHSVGRRALSLGIILGSPYPSPMYPTAPVRRALARVISERAGRYQLVCVEHEALAPLLPRARAERWIVTLHHLLSGMIESEIELAPGRRQRWFRERDLRKALALERRVVEDYDRCIVCSTEDAASLAESAGGVANGRVAVIPNGVDLVLVRPTSIPSAPTVLLPGHLAWQPNVDGAVWFCTEVWPRIRAEVPDASLMLAGRSPKEEVLALAALPGVSIHADVPSMVPYFEAARAVVVPLRVGTGTRLKALEGMAAARPVIGTSVGMGGLGIVDGVQARIADEPEKFAAAVAEALRQDELAGSLARNGRSHVESSFGWERVGAQFVTTVAEVLNEEPARASVGNARPSSSVA